MRAANPERGEVALLVNGQTVVLRPTFEALVAAEGELGSLFQLVDRAAEGLLTLQEIATLFRHVAVDEVSREQIGEALLAQGLAKTIPQLRTILSQVLQGR